MFDGVSQKPTRKERRQLERDLRKDVRGRMRLASLEEGGSAARPIVVASASLVEPTAKSIPCVACGSHVLLHDHEAEMTSEGPRRVVHVKCFQCGAPRMLYFMVQSSFAN